MVGHGAGGNLQAFQHMVQDVPLDGLKNRVRRQDMPHSPALFYELLFVIMFLRMIADCVKTGKDPSFCPFLPFQEAEGQDHFPAVSSRTVFP